MAAYRPQRDEGEPSMSDPSESKSKVPHRARGVRGVPLSEEDLRRQTTELRGTGGTSADNRHRGFLPAFRDSVTGKVYPSRHADGRPACVHLLEGLPADLVMERDAGGKVHAVKGSLEPGFTRGGYFYTREQAAALVRREDGVPPKRAAG